MEIHSLMPRIGGRGEKIPVSRDYKLVIPCKNISCPINKLDYCSMASAIKINSAGVCQTGRDLIEEKLKMEKEKNKNKGGYYKHEGD